MRTLKKATFKILIVIFLFLFVSIGGYFISFLRLDNSTVIDSEVLVLQNDMLKKELMNLRKFENDGEFIIGKVIIRNIHHFYNEIIVRVEKGSVQGGEAVINEEGLVGVVYEVDGDKAYVKLLSSDYNVSVRIGDTYGNLNAGNITLLDKYSDITVGDLVYTSGLNDIPKDIYVGKIVEVTMDEEKIGKKVKIELINNDDLNYVGIVSNIK